MKGADGWQLSNVNVLGTVGHFAALSVVEEAGWENLLAKSRKLTAFLWFLMNELRTKLPYFSIITPDNLEERGCQLSLHFPSHGREVFEFLEENGVIGDWREDQLSDTKERAGVIRIAPVPLYNTFHDVYQFSILLEKGLTLAHGK